MQIEQVIEARIRIRPQIWSKCNLPARW